MHALRMTEGDMAPGCARLTLTPASSGWELKGVDFEGREQTTKVKAIDGILFADPKGEAGRAVIWRHDAEEQAVAQAGTALQALHVDAGSAACIVAQDIAATTFPHMTLSGLFLVATGDGQEQHAELAIAAGAWRVQDLKDLFFERLPVLYGDDRRAVLPDYPVPAEWVSAVETSIVEPHLGQGGRPDRVTYYVKLLGLEGTLRRVYEAAELASLGDPDRDNLGWNFRLQVWPNVNLAGWRFYAVDVGLAYDADWTNQWHWGLFSHVKAQRENDPLPYRLAPCKPQALPAKPSKYATLHGLPGKRQRVVSQQRPNYIQIDCNLSGVRVGGVFNLLDDDPAISPDQGAVDLGIDIGTSNSCVSVSTSSGEVFSLDFNQMNGKAWPGTDFGPLVSHNKVGRPEQVRTLKPWLPGVEGPATAEAPAGHSPVDTQIPSLVVAMDDPDDETRLWDITSATDVTNALPFLDVVIPPADFVNSYSSPIWAERSFSKLKWFGDDPLLPKAFLKKYIVMLYMFAATKLRRTNFSVKLSYPLSFTDADRRNLLDAAVEAKTEVQQYANLTVNPQLYADESRCIVDKHVRTLDVRTLPIVVVCDIGGGSVDVAVATFDTEKKKDTMVFLGADSVRFGANLLFNRMTELLGSEAFPAPSTIAGDAKRSGYIVEKMRRAVRAGGYASILRRVGEGTRQLAKEYFQLYFLLVREFVARSVAGTIRNPYRLGGAIHRLRRGTGEPAWPEELAKQGGMPPMTLYGVCTGNGWRCLEALAKDQAMSRDLPVVRAFAAALAARVKALVAEPIAGESPDLGSSFGLMQLPGVEMAIGLKRTNEESGLMKEALADAILSYVSLSTTRTAELSAPNGVNERFQSFEDVLAGSAGRVVPWYAYVGSERMTWGNPMMDHVEPPDGTYALGESLGVSGDAGPAMPVDIRDAGLKFGRSLDVKDMLIGQLNDLTRGVRYIAGRRERPLLAVLYEVAYSQLFDKRWLHR